MISLGISFLALGKALCSVHKQTHSMSSLLLPLRPWSYFNAIDFVHTNIVRGTLAIKQFQILIKLIIYKESILKLYAEDSTSWLRNQCVTWYELNRGKLAHSNYEETLSPIGLKVWYVSKSVRGVCKNCNDVIMTSSSYFLRFIDILHHQYSFNDI